MATLEELFPEKKEEGVSLEKLFPEKKEKGLALEELFEKKVTKENVLEGSVIDGGKLKDEPDFIEKQGIIMLKVT